MEILEKLYGSAAKVKIMRLFLFNPGIVYDLKSIAGRAKVHPVAARKEIGLLCKIGLLKSRAFYKEVKRGKGKKAKMVKVKAFGWVLDNNFPYLAPLQNFLIHSSSLKHNEIAKKLNGAGRMKLLIVSGVFIQNPESRVDMLIVGDNLRKNSIDTIVRNIEAEIGKELKYATFDTEDFKYRLGMYDKLVRDVLDYPHEKVINRLGVELS